MCIHTALYCVIIIWVVFTVHNDIALILSQMVSVTNHTEGVVTCVWMTGAGNNTGTDKYMNDLSNEPIYTSSVIKTKSTVISRLYSTHCTCVWITYVALWCMQCTVEICWVLVNSCSYSFVFCHPGGEADITRQHCLLHCHLQSCECRLLLVLY